MELDRAHARLKDDDDDLEVVITTRDASIGAIATAPVRSVNVGFDWEAGKFLIWPDYDLVRRRTGG